MDWRYWLYGNDISAGKLVTACVKHFPDATVRGSIEKALPFLVDAIGFVSASALLDADRIIDTLISDGKSRVAWDIVDALWPEPLEGRVIFYQGAVCEWLDSLTDEQVYQTPINELAVQYRKEHDGHEDDCK